MSMTVSEKKSKTRREYEAFMQKVKCPLCDWRSNRLMAIARRHQLLSHIMDEHWEMDNDEVHELVEAAVKKNSLS